MVLDLHIVQRRASLSFARCLHRPGAKIADIADRTAAQEASAKLRANAPS